VGNQSRAALKAAYADVTAFDLAVDAYRAETAADIARVEWLALLLVGLRAAKTAPIESPDGKVTGPLDEHIAAAYRRLRIVRDHLSPEEREVARLRELDDRDRVKAHRRAAWQDREDLIARVGFVNATARRRTA
jgi:hypothetical protein